MLVLVSGAPATGKTPLAAALGFPLIAKDDLKETLYDALDVPPGDLEWSRRTGAAAMELLWMLAGRCPDAVLEANFRATRARERLRSLTADLVEVHCGCAPEEARRRFQERHAGRHPAHHAELASVEGDYDPLGLGPVIEVDTTRPVDLAVVVQGISMVSARSSSAKEASR
jgi:predicted kinase